MKPLRFSLKTCALALLGISTLSCIDNTYDLSDLSSEATLFRNTLSAPVGTATIYLDSIFGGQEIDSFSVKNNIYVFGYSGNFVVDNLSNTFNSFSFTNISKIESTIPLYDARTLPVSSLPYSLPSSENQTYNGTMDVNLQGLFDSNFMKIDSAALNNTSVRISAVCTGLTGGNGKSIGDNLKITFSANGNAADYYIGNVKQTSWDLPLDVSGNGSVTVKIGKIRLTDGLNKLRLNRSVKVQIVNAGDIKVINNIQTNMKLSIEFVNGVDYSMAWGKVNYGMDGKLDDIKFEGLSDIIRNNDVFSIYDPKITLTTSSNLGVPVKFQLNMSSLNTKTRDSASLTRSTFNMPATSSPLILRPDTFRLDRTNGTSNLFKINPDLIKLSYHFQTDTTVANHFIAKGNTTMNVGYKMEIPLQFGNDLKISIDTTLENPFADNLDKLENQQNLGVGITLNVKNRIPLNMKIQLEALDSNFGSLFTVQTDTIFAAKTTAAGLANQITETNTEISLTPTQINKIKDTKMFRMSFVVTVNKGVAFVSLQKTDYITIKIGGKINGGVLIDLSSKSKK